MDGGGDGPIEAMLPEEVVSGTEPARRTPQYVATIAASLSALAAGTMMAWTSPVLPELQDANSTTAPFHVTKEQGSWVGSLVAVGSMAGCLPAGPLAQLLGRRIVLLGLALPLLVSWVVVIVATGVGALYAARLLAGISIGGICAVAPMYIAEIAHSSIRGTLGSFFQLMITIGLLFTYCVGAAASYQWLAIACLLVTLAFEVCFFFVPETPSFLLAKGREQDARRALLWLRGRNYDCKEEFDQLRNEAGEAALQKPTVLDVLKSPVCRRALILSLGLMAIQQLSGINAVVFYTTSIFEEAGSSMSPAVSTIVVGAVMVGATCASSVLMDRLGRRALLLLSTSVMAACLAALGLHVELRLQGVAWLPLLSVCLYIVVFSLGMGPVPWLMMGELFAPEAKSVASGASVFTNYLLVFAITKSFEPMSSALGAGVVYWVYGAICAAGTAFVFFLVPETKGKTMQQIQDMLAEGRTA